jgi:integrase
MKLTVSSVSDLRLPAGKTDHIVFDDDVPGFGIRLRQGGARWVFQYKIGAQHRRMTFGRYPALKVPAARDQAEKLHAKVKLGLDPAGEKAENRARAGETFGSCVALYLAKRREEEGLRPTTFIEIERHLSRNLKPLHGMRIDKVDRRAIAVELNRLSVDAPVQANRTRASLVKFLNWCGGEGYVETNAAMLTNRNAEKSRERVLSIHELVQVWLALPAGDFGDITKLLMLSAARRDEIADLEWIEVDLDAAMITLPPARTKNHRKHLIPLSDAAKRIIVGAAERKNADRPLVFGRGERGFSGWSQSKRRLDEHINMPPWTLHDIRRSVDTAMGDHLGVPPHVVEAILNHVSGVAKGGVSGIYNHAQYLTERREALNAWAVHLINAAERMQQ